MSKFLEKLEEDILDKALKLPPDRNLERLTTLYCNKAYKDKIENEVTNQAIRYVRASNHSDIPATFQIGGVYVRIVVSEIYDEPVIKAGYYDKQDN